jgi:hypothetical protein
MEGILVHSIDQEGIGRTRLTAENLKQQMPYVEQTYVCAAEP